MDLWPVLAVKALIEFEDYGRNRRWFLQNCCNYQSYCGTVLSWNWNEVQACLPSKYVYDQKYFCRILGIVRLDLKTISLFSQPFSKIQFILNWGNILICPKKLHFVIVIELTLAHRIK
jgi:hypothetical protein